MKKLLYEIIYFDADEEDNVFAGILKSSLQMLFGFLLLGAIVGAICGYIYLLIWLSFSVNIFAGMLFGILSLGALVYFEDRNKY